MASTQTVTLKGRDYTFTPGTDPELDGYDNRYVGDLTNSRGEFAGWVFEMNASGARLLMGGPKGIPAREERTALSNITVSPAA